MKAEHASLISPNSNTSPVLRSMRASGTLDGLLLSMSLRQVFRNESRRNLEVVYTFPLQWGAVLTGLQATLAGKRMTGQVKARDAARQEYEDAVESGDAPVMVEKAQNGVFSAMLGSLKPGEEAVIEIEYAQLLSFEQGNIRLVVPTTIAPRYGDATTQGGLPPHQVPTPDLFAEHKFELAITLKGVAASGRVSSPSHRVAQQRSDDAVTVTLVGEAWLDRDFVLLLESLQASSFAIAGPELKGAEGQCAVIASYCPRLPNVAPAPLRLKVLVDCSGSMAGDSIGQARRGLGALMTQLDQADCVSYSRFGNRTVRVIPPVLATPTNIAALVHAVETTEADLGGTELGAALNDTLALRGGAIDGEQEADILLVTDGEVWNAQAIVDAAQRSGQRIYALGVGSAPADSLLRELAETTGGACEFVSPNENMEVAITRLLKRIQSAVKVYAAMQLAQSAAWASPLPKRLVPEDTIHMFLRLTAPPTTAPALVISGVALPSTLVWRKDDLVSRLVAARQISLCKDDEAAAALAERYQLVTDHTNLLLVFERAAADKTDGMPALHQVRTMMAAGWGGAGAQEPVLCFSRAPETTACLRDAHVLDSYAVLASIDDSYCETLVEDFNTAVAEGLSFRHAIGRIAALSMPRDVQRAMDMAKARLGSPAAAWTCLLFVLHESGDAALKLSSPALALVNSQIAKLDAMLCEKVCQQFGIDIHYRPHSTHIV